MVPGPYRVCIKYLGNKWPKEILPSRASSKHPQTEEHKTDTKPSNHWKVNSWIEHPQVLFLETKGRRMDESICTTYRQRTEALICQVQTGKALEFKACPSRWMNTLNELCVTWMHILNLRQYSVPHLGSPINCTFLGCTALTQVISVLELEVLELNSHKPTQQLHKEGRRETHGPEGSARHQYSVIITAGKSGCRKSLIKDIKVL